MQTQRQNYLYVDLILSTQSKYYTMQKHDYINNAPRTAQTPRQTTNIIIILLLLQCRKQQLVALHSLAMVLPSAVRYIYYR